MGFGQIKHNIYVHFNFTNNIYCSVNMYHLFSEYGDCYDELSDSVHYMNINAEIKHKQPQCLNWTGTKKYVRNENAF